jgi:hypothetical protein
MVNGVYTVFTLQSDRIFRLGSDHKTGFKPNLMKQVA